MESLYSINLSENTLYLKGDIVFSTVERLSLTGGQLLSAESLNPIVINLAEVTRIDSAGVALLLEWKRLAHRLNKYFLLEELQKQTVSLITTYKLEELLAFKHDKHV